MNYVDKDSFELPIYISASLVLILQMCAPTHRSLASVGRIGGAGVIPSIGWAPARCSTPPKAAIPFLSELQSFPSPLKLKAEEGRASGGSAFDRGSSVTGVLEFLSLLVKRRRDAFRRLSLPPQAFAWE